MTITKTFQKGSVWRKWDLQVQTRLDNDYSCLGNSLESEKLQQLTTATGLTEAEITSQEKSMTADKYAKLFINYVTLFTDVSVIGITDHNTGNELDHLINEANQTNEKLTIIPGVEVSSSHGIHILCLFNPEKPWKDTWANSIEHFMTEIGLTGGIFNSSGQPNNATKTSQEIMDIVAEKNGISIFAHIATENGLFYRQSSTANGGTAHKDIYTHQFCQIVQIPHTSSIDIGTQNIINGKDPNYENKSVTKIKCSDARKLSEIGSQYAWIKAEQTFEGLKQIIYEPETRIFIGEEKPKKPINTIDIITLKIPVVAKVGKDKFCFAENDSSYSLSPYFNCFIGGRGSGKSTILNFLGLHSNNPDSPKKFWNNLSPSFNPSDNNIFSFDGTEIFEFLAQSEIETFARDKSKFTQAIYDRANSHAGNILEEYEEAIESLKGKLGQIIQAVSHLKTLEDQKFGKEKEKRTLESSIKVLSSKEYNEVITGITDKSKELQRLEDWKENISDLKNSLSELIPESESEKSKEEAEKTEYEEAYNLAIFKIAEAVELLKEEKFADEAKKEAEIKKALTELEAKAKTLIEKAGYTPESVEQIKSAPQKITNLESEIKSLTTQIETKTKVIATLETVVAGLNTNRQNYETKITEILKPLQDLLKKQFEDNQGKDIKQISLEYSFNEKGAWITLAEEFYNHFFSKYHDTERSKEVCEFITGNKQAFSKNSFDDVRKIIQQSQKNDKKYTKFLDEVFKEEKNFQIFQAIRDKHLYDVKLNKIIQVKYDNRDVEQASFGQRCTAVVVILLLFGNYPLIIDEPEAHLDSSLIANYLVPLLKEKKSDRQIIFATHNANFVINGDAEKIFILKNESGQTEVIETTIEDTKNREELLKLEGGKEAFEKRGEKLNIR